MNRMSLLSSVPLHESDCFVCVPVAGVRRKCKLVARIDFPNGHIAANRVCSTLCGQVWAQAKETRDLICSWGDKPSDGKYSEV